MKTYRLLLDDDLHAEIKSASAKSGKTMREFIVQAIKEAIIKKGKQ